MEICDQAGRIIENPHSVSSFSSKWMQLWGTFACSAHTASCLKKAPCIEMLLCKAASETSHWIPVKAARQKLNSPVRWEKMISPITFPIDRSFTFPEGFRPNPALPQTWHFQQSIPGPDWQFNQSISQINHIRGPAGAGVQGPADKSLPCRCRRTLTTPCAIESAVFACRKWWSGKNLDFPNSKELFSISILKPPMSDPSGHLLILQVDGWTSWEPKNKPWKALKTQVYPWGMPWLHMITYWKFRPLACVVNKHWCTTSCNEASSRTAILTSFFLHTS